MSQNFCHKCSAPLPSDARFCPECGAPIFKSARMSSAGTTLWLYALIPLLGFALTFAGLYFFDEDSPIIDGSYFLLALILGLADRRYVRRLGYPDTHWFWAVFTPPIYLFLRIKRTTHNYLPLVLYIVLSAAIFTLFYQAFDYLLEKNSFI